MSIPSDPTGPTEPVSSRRHTDRKPSKLNKALEVTFEASDDETAKLSTLHLHDLSGDGMRVETQERWKANSRIFLRIPLTSFGEELPRVLTVECEVRWCKLMVGGQAQYGLRFVEPNSRQAEVIELLLDRLTVIGGRHHHRVKILMPVEMELKDKKMSIVVIRSLSHGGVRFRAKERLEDKKIIKFRLPIPDGQHVSGHFKLAWKVQLDDGSYEYGAAFRQISDAEKVLINQLIAHEASPA